MARLLCITLIISVSVLTYVLAEEELYSDQYDGVDVQALYNNKDMRDTYSECLMDRAKCQSDILKFAAETFSKAYRTNCNQCTEKQKGNMKIITEWYTKNEPDKWKIIVAKAEEDMKADQ